VLVPLLYRLNAEVERAGLQRAADVELRALPAFVWLQQSGVPFDRPAWEALEATAAAKKAALAGQLTALAPVKGQDGLFGHLEEWNWDSPKQVAEVFDMLGVPLGVEVRDQFVETTNDAALALCTHPLADLLRDHRHQSQLVKMYGPNCWHRKPRSGGPAVPRVAADGHRHRPDQL
jgi:hypothetical protein